MKRAAVPLVLALLGISAVAAGLSASADYRVIDLIAIGTALMVGDLVELRPANRSPIPMGFAIVVVLLRVATPTEFVIVVATTSVLASSLLPVGTPISTRGLYLAELLAAGIGAGAIYRVITDASSLSSRVGMLGALAAAAMFEIFVADLISLRLDRQFASLRARGADVAIVTSGILMAVGYGGLSGQGRLGLWGPALFSIPLLAVWYSFELLGRTRQTFRQTVQALGIAPELGALVRSGHVERVAHLAVSIGSELGVSESQLEDLETAAWLHHLGAVCLDDPSPGEEPDATAVARAGAEMLRVSQALSNAGDIVAAEPSLHRSPRGRAVPAPALLGQVLKVASAYDELTEGDDSHGAWAVEALFTGPAYVYDGRVLTALEQVLAKRGVLSP